MLHAYQICQSMSQGVSVRLSVFHSPSFIQRNIRGGRFGHCLCQPWVQLCRPEPSVFAHGFATTNIWAHTKQAMTMCSCYTPLLSNSLPWHVVNAAALEGGVVPTGVPIATSSHWEMVRKMRDIFRPDTTVQLLIYMIIRSSSAFCTC